jgi:HAE1 family hydrophobic/amphiphilic exporter-1
MNLSEIFIRRPVMTTLVMLGILVFGIAAYRSLPVSDLPNVDFPSILVSASLPGASPETMASSVATPLEREFSTIAGIDSMSSTSQLGSTQITLVFSLNRNIDAAAQDVQAAIARANRRLPPDMPNPPSYQKVNPADQPVLFLAMTSPTLPLYKLNEYADTLMAQRISMVSGVAQVVVYGAQKFAVRVQVDPQELASRGIGLDEVAQKIQQANVNLPTGIIDGRHRAFTVESTGQLLEAADYRPVIVAYRNGNPVRLSDLGRVIDSVENDRIAAYYSRVPDFEQRSVVLAIQRQPGTNTVEVVDSIRRLLPTFRNQLPASVTIHDLYDRSESIRDSVRDVQFTLVLTLCLVVLVIFLFLRSFWATTIPAIAMPMSIIGAFVVMNRLGYSLDNLSLMALTLSIGFVVDDAIVMLENIVRHMEMGETRLRAALDGSRQISFTILSMTISLAAVFIPILFMPGLVGRLFNEFAVVIAVAILISGFVSLSLTPMLSSRFLRPPGQAHHGRLYAWSENVFRGMLWLYEVGLRWSMRHRAAVMLFSAAVLAGTVWLFMLVPKGFLPTEDSGRIIAQTEGAQGISFEALNRAQRQVADIVRADPNVDSFMSMAGRTPNSGFLFLKLKPRDQRERSADQVVQSLRRQVNQVPGLTTIMFVPPPIQIGGRLTRSQYQYTIQGPDTDQLFRLAPVLAEKMKQIPGLQDVTTDLQLQNPQISVIIDRDKASAPGHHAPADRGGTGQRVRQPADFDDFRPHQSVSGNPGAAARVPREDRSPCDAVHPLADHGPARAAEHAGQTHPEHRSAVDQPYRPAAQRDHLVSIWPPAPPSAAPSTRLNASPGRCCPPTSRGPSRAPLRPFRWGLGSMLVLLILAVAVIYMVLGILYESFIHPITILSALPFAGFGALLTLLIFRVELSLYAYVGIIMLVGLVKKNGIMMIDFAIDAQRTEGKAPAEAIYQACVIRFRPIMMTTMAALMGTLPIAIGYGAGAESRQPLGLAVVGGLLFSQMLTLFVTPVFYLYMEAFRNKLAGRKAAAPLPQEAVVTENAESVPTVIDRA